MNKLIVRGVWLVMLMTACSKTDDFTYASPDNIYFDFASAGDRDSLVYTFAYNPALIKDTIFLPVRLSGIRMSEGRTFGIQVVDTATTAIANTHYEPFKASYTMPADTGWYYLPVIVLNKDESLVTRSVALTMQLTGTNELGIELSSLIKARIVLSNRLEKPKWWEMWLGSYYSQVKHQLFRLTATTSELSTSGLDAPKNLYYVGKLSSFLNDPFTWVTANPDKGYMLQTRADGNYNFYYTGTPDKKILLRKNTAANKFYFIDEAGKEVI